MPELGVSTELGWLLAALEALLETTLAELLAIMVDGVFGFEVVVVETMLLPTPELEDVLVAGV